MDTGRRVRPKTSRRQRRVAVVVAHPGDEVVWCGGTIITHRKWSWRVVAIHRPAKSSRSAAFAEASRRLGSSSLIAGAGPDALDDGDVCDLVRSSLHREHYDLLVTHGPQGASGRAAARSQLSRCVTSLWSKGDVAARRLRLFAYEDVEASPLARPAIDAHLAVPLSERVAILKSELVQHVYGFAPGGPEATAAAKHEAFWVFNSRAEYAKWASTRPALPSGA
jgi:hypothetical protein